MSYIINYTDRAVLNRNPIVVEEKTLNTDTSLTFLGKNTFEYGTVIGENFLHLLENFANSSPPSNPITGQLWYDTTAARPQLLIWDGTNWTEAGNVKKGTSQPGSETSIAGDIWVDSENQQLYLFNGAAWTLVGPQFSESTATGLRVDTLIDRDSDTDKFVLSFYINDNPVIIISRDNFTPKLSIPGFSIIRQGVNMSNLDFNLDGSISNKFWGVSEKAESLVVGNSVIPSTNFLRGDAVSTTNFTLNVRSAGGLVLGQQLETAITSSNSGAVISHKTPGSAIILKTTGIAGSTNNVLTITGNERIGINNSNPSQALDVNGNILTNGQVTITNTDNSALMVSGGVNVSGLLTVENNAAVRGVLTVGAASSGATILPTVTNTQDIGTSTVKFRNIHATNFIGGVFTGSFSGNLVGDITGAANRLTNTASFSLRGDVTSNVIPFNGALPVPDRSIFSVSRNAAGISSITTSVPHTFVTGFIVSVTCSDSSFNTIGSVITVTSPTTFTYSNAGLERFPVSATGSTRVNPGGSFVTTISDGLISNKTELTDSLNSDFFLVYRPTAVPALRKINKATLFASAGTVPAGTIFPYGGIVPPKGYLFCDGSEQSQASYPELYSTIGFKFKPKSALKGTNTFAMPDFRGRLPAGNLNMDNGNVITINTTATNVTRLSLSSGAVTATFQIPISSIVNGPFQVGRVLTGTGLVVTLAPAIITQITLSSTVATVTVSVQPQVSLAAATGLSVASAGVIDAVPTASSPRISSATDSGIVGGSETRTLAIKNLPQHEHNMKGSAGTQFYGINDLNTVPTDTGSFRSQGPSASNDAQFLPSSGNIKTNEQLQQPFDITNPYLSINYIIFTGRTE